MKANDPPAFSTEEEKFVEELSEKYGVPPKGFDTSIHEPTGELFKGSADTGDVSYQGPTMSFATTCAAVGSPGYSYANVDQYGSSIGKKGTVYAAKILASNAIDLLTDPALLEKAIAEYKERMRELEYVPVLASDWRPPVPETNPEFFKGPEPISRPDQKEPESLLYWRKGKFKRNLLVKRKCAPSADRVARARRGLRRNLRVPQECKPPGAPGRDYGVSRHPLSLAIPNGRKCALLVGRRHPSLCSLRAVEDRVVEQFVCGVGLCAVLDVEPEQHDVAPADLGFDHSGFAAELLFADQEAAQQKWLIGKPGNDLNP